MKDTKEIVLFFKDTYKLDSVNLSKELMDRYQELGEPIIVPNNNNGPLIIFNENNEFQIQVTNVNVSIILKQHYFANLEVLIFDVVDAFEAHNIYFKRIGYISSIFLPPSAVSRAKERFLKMDYLDDVSDINLGWYKELKKGNITYNCWERIITDVLNFSDLLCQYDINSKNATDFVFTMKNIKEFINLANDYIEERINF